MPRYGASLACCLRALLGLNGARLAVPFFVGPHITVEMVTRSMDMQSELFDMAPEPQENHNSNKKEFGALDEMFAASRRFRSSAEYMNMLNFISRLPKHAPFNCLLLYTQNPAVSYVATATQWLRNFGRQPKHDARPLVILVPFGPVLFVYDLKDTDGPGPLPTYLLRPFNTEGKLKKAVFDRTVHNSNLHGIQVRHVVLRHYHGGSAIKLTPKARQYYNDLKLAPDSQYLILLSHESTLEDNYSSLVHELGHIFCGHLGVDSNAWWHERHSLSKTEVEIEAESVSFFVCRRHGLLASSENYLSNYRTGEDRCIPPLGLNAIFQATTYIEEMGRSKWGKPKKKSRYKKEKQ